ncbi:hypothetical protein GC163_11365 [bacterium]|nr:hypothetical protein [bacterium]
MPHRKEVKHYHEPGHLHEFTFSCYQRQPLLTNDSGREQLSRTMDEAGRIEQFDLVAFVFMPEHVHLLANPRSAEPQFGRYLARIKQPFSKAMKQILIDQNSPLVGQLTVHERPGKTSFRFWQEGAGFDRNFFSPSAITSAIDYIHQNPVRRGLCVRATDWPWSSARYYLCEPPRQQFPEFPTIHGPPPGVFD